jgi:hypothetical protein
MAEVRRDDWLDRLARNAEEAHLLDVANRHTVQLERLTLVVRELVKALEALALTSAT